MQGVAVVLLICLCIAAVPSGQACSPPMFWRPKGLLTRMQSAPVVFLGKVTSTSHSSTPFISGLYEATFEVECYYKGEELNQLVTVGHFGWDGGRCTSSDVEEGENYVIMADVYPGYGLSVAHINIQSGATEATENVIHDIEQIFPCQKPTA